MPKCSLNVECYTHGKHSTTIRQAAHRSSPGCVGFIPVLLEELVTLRQGLGEDVPSGRC